MDRNMNNIRKLSNRSARRILSTRNVLVNLGLLTAGSIILAFGVNAILVPKQFLSGGGLGVALTLHYLFPHLSVSFLYIFVNIPLIVLGWFNVSQRFMLYTAFGIVAFSVAIRLIRPAALAIENPILAAVLAGIICGVGMGLIFDCASFSLFCQFYYLIASFIAVFDATIDFKMPGRHIVDQFLAKFFEYVSSIMQVSFRIFSDSGKVVILREHRVTFFDQLFDLFACTGAAFIRRLRRHFDTPI